MITHDENIALQADRIIAIEDGHITRDRGEQIMNIINRFTLRTLLKNKGAYICHNTWHYSCNCNVCFNNKYNNEFHRIICLILCRAVGGVAGADIQY